MTEIRDRKSSKPICEISIPSIKILPLVNSVIRNPTPNKDDLPAPISVIRTVT